MSKINSLLKKTELFERLALYGDRRSFLQSLAQDAGPSLDGGHSGNLATDPNMTVNPNAKFGPPSPPAAGKPSIPREVQRKLNELLVSSGKIVPVKEDGILGSDTRLALNAFRKAYNVPASTTDQQVFSQVMAAHSLESDYAAHQKPGMESVSPEDQVFDTLKQPGPTVASLLDKATLFQKLSQKYEK